MNTPILVTYATEQGYTAEVAQTIAEALSGQGNAVTLLPMSRVTDLSGYRAVVVGAPIYSAQWLPEATAFVKTHRDALAAMPTACFILAIRLRLDDEGVRQAVLGATATERLLMKPAAVGLFAGALDYSRLPPIMRMQAQGKGLPEGDFRDWEAIRTWAAAIGPLLAGG